MSRFKGSYHDIVAAIVLYLVCLLCVGLMWQSPVLLALLVLSLGIAALLIWREPVDRIYYFVPLVLGPCGELLAVHLGAWKYTGAAYLIPIWLPLIWGLAGICMGRVMTVLQTMRRATPQPTG